MLKSSRRLIPRQTERNVLFRNQSICCVCQKRGVQIHHIDGNPSNNSPSNLCVLCIEHHAEASSTSAMVKGLSSSLLRQYKKAWEASVIVKYEVAAAKRAERPSHAERRAIALDIKKTIFQMVGNKSTKQVNESIDYLYGLCLLEMGPNEIIRNFVSVHWLLELRTLAVLVLRLHDFFMGFVGPGYVKMSAKDERQVIAAIKLLGGIGVQAVVFEANSFLFTRLRRAFSQFAQVGLDYRRKAIGKTVIEEINKVKGEFKESSRPTRLRLGVKRLDSAVEIATAALKQGPRRVGFEALLKKSRSAPERRSRLQQPSKKATPCT
jgi:HNH endonuclease